MNEGKKEGKGEGIYERKVNGNNKKECAKRRKPVYLTVINRPFSQF